MSFLQLHDLRYGDGAFAKRVAVAVAKTALATMADVNATAAQKTWAREALRTTQDMAQRFLWGVIGDATVQTQGGDVTDAHLQTVVAGLIDAVGVGA